MDICKNYDPTWKIYLISLVGQVDKTFEPLRDRRNFVVVNPKNIPPAEYFFQQGKCITIWDDVRNIKDFDVSIQSTIATVGRHHRVVQFSTSHLMKDYQYTRFILPSAKYLVVFPAYGGHEAISTLLENRIPWRRKKRLTFLAEVAKESRWCLFHFGKPTYCLTQHRLMLM